MKDNREKINMSYDGILKLWDGLYHIGRTYKTKDGEFYTSVDIINTSDKSDGESCDYIVRRESDGKFFKFNWCDRKGVPAFSEIIEVFPESVTITKYK